ncbi:hypothetical protein [Streptomyces sp. NPDC051561]|uniref:hypothetical protein n=1 Tax=Streptomyces sp. NPDC051561 TaxID=3365658 RepID=UPI0037ABA39C
MRCHDTAVVLDEGDGPGSAHATAEIAAMYDPALGVERLDRTLVLTPAGRLVLLDLAEAAGTGPSCCPPSPAGSVPPK